MIVSFKLKGIDAESVHIEAQPPTAGQRKLVIAGLNPATEKETVARVCSAIGSMDEDSGTTTFTPKLANVIVSPAAGTHAKQAPAGALDLPIALAILAAHGKIDAKLAARFVVFGELSLSGKVQACRGAIPAAELAKQNGLALICPASQANEAAQVPGVIVFGAETLQEAVDHLTTGGKPIHATAWARHDTREQQPDMAEIVGQDEAIRALALAAVGRHHVLIVGPPGAGKTMLARRLTTILPELNDDERLEIARAYSAAGLYGHSIQSRPFRAPHHSISDAGMIGSVTYAGEMTLANHGVLMLDEVNEFRKTTLEAVRMAARDGYLIVRHDTTLPTAFQVVATMDSTRYDGQPNKLPIELKDFFDIVIHMDPIDISRPDWGTHGRSDQIREQVTAARKRLRDLGQSPIARVMASIVALDQPDLYAQALKLNEGGVQ